MTFDNQPPVEPSPSPLGEPVGPTAIERLQAEEAGLRTAGRAALGVSEDAHRLPLGEALRSHGGGLYPLSSLCVLALVNFSALAAFALVGPDIAVTLGIGAGTIASINLVVALATTLATLPVAALVQNHARRALLTVASGALLSVFVILTGFVTEVWGLFLTLLVVGLAGGAALTLHIPLLMDSYGPQGRIRAFSVYQGAQRVAFICGPLAVGICSGLLGLTWRGVFVALGLVSLAGTLACVGLRDPGFGKYDIDKVREAVRSGGTDGDAQHEIQVNLGFFEICKRVMLIPTVARLMAVAAMFGAFLYPFQTFIQFFFADRWHMNTTQRSVLAACLPIFTIPTLIWFGRWGEAAFRRDPARLTRLMSLIVFITMACIAIAVLVPNFVLMIVFFGVGFAGFSLFTPGIQIITLSLVRPQHRPHVSALLGMMAAAAGGVGGILFLDAIQTRFGTPVALASLAIPGFLVALLVRSAARTVNDDLDQLVDEVIEQEELDKIAATGQRLPMLTCRKIDFSYGQLQVLFGVGFTVDESEMVALLGTNGAGKSTLLRVIAGLGLPTRGSVHFGGADITYLDAEKRLPLGISTVLGGRAVFAPLSVVDNLRVYGHMHKRKRAAVERGIEASFEAFPALAQRRNQLASTLSGGEQQMLALCQAYIVPPRLLLVDELSLGLAPIVVGQLLDMVSRINSRGTAVVLVEQSVNIALSVVDHAYFMEKGEIRFDGPATDLVGRDDLLRSVFLAGASQGLA